MKAFLTALQFLTILPVKLKPIEKKEFGRALLYFPMVGLVIGLIAISMLAITGFLPHLVKSALIVVVLIVLTGAVHLDGFIDTCDGLYGGTSKERMLEIMRDSSIGAIGVIGVTALLITKVASLASMPAAVVPRAILCMTAFARLSQVFACSLYDYAREEGKAKCFIKHAEKGTLFFAAVFTLIVFIVLMGTKGPILFVSALCPALLFMNWIDKRLGGMTGDTIGAVNEFTEVTTLLLFLIF